MDYRNVQRSEAWKQRIASEDKAMLYSLKEFQMQRQNYPPNHHNHSTSQLIQGATANPSSRAYLNGSISPTRYRASSAFSSDQQQHLSQNQQPSQDLMSSSRSALGQQSYGGGGGGSIYKSSSFVNANVSPTRFRNTNSNVPDGYQSLGLPHLIVPQKMNYNQPNYTNSSFQQSQDQLNQSQQVQQQLQQQYLHHQSQQKIEAPPRSPGAISLRSNLSEISVK